MVNKMMPKVEMCFLTKEGRQEVKYEWINVSEVGRIEHWEWFQEGKRWKKEEVWS
jgi:hypothetical protein